jgi:2-polyprenyl-3-methyl-5-hydroxy-6-metoxy-1,4-benzoquinol methylase
VTTPLVWTDELAARYWRWQAQFPGQYFTNRFGGLVAHHLRSLLGGRTNILDYGSGVGFLVPHLAALGLKVSATDASPEAVAATNARNKDVPNFRGATTIAELLRVGQRFDAVVSVEVIEHLSDEHLESFFASLRRLLAPGGIAVITTPNEEDLRAAETYCPHCDLVFHRWQHLRSWSAATLAAAVAAHGLVVERTFATDFARNPWRDPLAEAKRLVKRLVGRPVSSPHLVCIARAPG